MGRLNPLPLRSTGIHRGATQVTFPDLSALLLCSANINSLFFGAGNFVTTAWISVVICTSVRNSQIAGTETARGEVTHENIREIEPANRLIASIDGETVEQSCAVGASKCFLATALHFLR